MFTSRPLVHDDGGPRQCLAVARQHGGLALGSCRLLARASGRGTRDAPPAFDLDRDPGVTDSHRGHLTDAIPRHRDAAADTSCVRTPTCRNGSAADVSHERLFADESLETPGSLLRYASSIWESAERGSPHDGVSVDWVAAKLHDLLEDAGRGPAAGKLLRVLTFPESDPVGVTTPAFAQIGLFQAKRSSPSSLAIALNAVSGSTCWAYIVDIAPIRP